MIEREIKGDQAYAIRPAYGKKTEPFDEFLFRMIKDFRQEFHFFRAGAVARAVVDDRDLLSGLIGQIVHGAQNVDAQVQQSISPVEGRVFEEIRCCVFTERSVRILRYASENIFSGKG